ncbi:hypothetical protein GGR51DRAFT_556202 [Nemania sp. FL0031]|nr:hypothetical protein GGR51DRAFT_556202 [Nemania sp. FL0031]
MSQGFKAVPLSHLLNPITTIPLSHILNPHTDTLSSASLNPGREVSLAQILNPTREIPLAQILNPVEEQSPAIPSGLQVADGEPPHPEIVPTSSSHPQGHDGESVVLEDSASDAEKSIAKRMAENIIQGLQSDAVAPLADFWQTLDADFPPLQMADKLWDRSRCQDDPKPVRWVNRFYASCMRQILRRRGRVPVNSNKSEDSQRQSKDRCAASTDVINMVADRFGDKVYAGLAIKNFVLSKLFSVRQSQHAVLYSLLATELEGLIESTNKSIRNPAVVISLLWKENYSSICKELKMYNSSKGLLNPGPTFYGSADLDEPISPRISEKLKEKIMLVTLGDLSHKKRYRPEDREPHKIKPSPKVYTISRWTQSLKTLCTEIEEELCATVKNSFKEPLRWRSTLMLIERGSIRRDTKACVNWIIPLKLKGSDPEAKAQFDTGPGTKAELKEWLSLQLVTIGGDTCIRKVDDPLAFIWIQWYQRQHWPWLDKNSLEDGVDHGKTSR